MLNKIRKDSGKLVFGFRSRVLVFVFRCYLLLLAIREYRNPWLAMMVLRRLVNLKRSLVGNTQSMKWLRSNGRYFWNVSSPGWPSKAFRAFISHEMNRIVPLRKRQSQLQTLILSITSRCPLACKHCYEWKNLAGSECLSLLQLRQILDRFQRLGVSHVELSGGEPLSRFDDLIVLLQGAGKGTEFWILTSGFELDYRKARALKKAGLTGAVISLDHFNETKHNEFRANPESYSWVWKAVKNAQSVGLAVALSLCATREFINTENLEKYLKLAKDMGVWIVRILEPRAVGHFSECDIELGEEQFRILDEFYLKLTNDPDYRDFPILDYLAYYQRRTGCFGGDRYLYVDSKGEMHSCPFCQESAGSALAESLDEILVSLRGKGCHKYPRARAKSLLPDSCMLT